MFVLDPIYANTDENTLDSYRNMNELVIQNFHWLNNLVGVVNLNINKPKLIE